MSEPMLALLLAAARLALPLAPAEAVMRYLRERGEKA